MRSGLVKPFLLLMLLFALSKTEAQTCQGTLGDAVIKEDFGAGTGAGPPLPAGVTNMSYTPTSCPNDGSYTITNAENSSCFDTWHVVPQDHTGDPNGRMMVINASYTASTFYTQHADGLCSKTTYEFSAYVLNILNASASSTSIQPDLTFTVKTTAGAVLKTLNTGNIPASYSPSWVRYSLLFETPPGVENVIVELTNNAPGGNGNDLVLDDIEFRACGPLVQTGFVAIADNTAKTQCAGENKTYSLVANIGAGYTDPQVQWQQDNGDDNWVDMAGKTNTNISVMLSNAAAGIHRYRVGAAEGANINSLHCRVYSEPLVVNINPVPVVPAISPQTVCEGDVLSISASGGSNYTWTGPGVTEVNKNKNPLVITDVPASAAGSYSVVVSSASGCSVSVGTTVVVTPRPVVTLSDATINLCKGESKPIQVFASAAASYTWSPATGLDNTSSASVVANPTETTIYTVIVMGTNGCPVSKTVTVNVLSAPIADAGPDQKIIDGKSVKLQATATDADTFYWTPTTGLDDPLSLTPTASPSEDITYTLHASSSANCGTATSTVFVKVFKRILVPNTFSPNGDGKNDFWDIQALSSYTKCVVNVYNRYGTQVYHNIGYTIPFKGDYNGSPLPEGTYYYIIDPKDDAPILTGWVLIVH